MKMNDWSRMIHLGQLCVFFCSERNPVLEPIAIGLYKGRRVVVCRDLCAADVQQHGDNLLMFDAKRSKCVYWDCD